MNPKRSDRHRTEILLHLTNTTARHEVETVTVSD